MSLSLRINLGKPIAGRAAARGRTIRSGIPGVFIRFSGPARLMHYDTMRNNAAGPASTILVCGPSPTAVGGGPAHIRNLWASPLNDRFRLEFFQTGSSGKESPALDEPFATTLRRLIISPFALAVRIASTRPAVVHVNSATDRRGFHRDTVLLAVAKLFRRPVVYQLHGSSIHRLTNGPVMRWWAQRVFSVPDVVVVLASSTASQFKDLETVRLIELVPNGVDVGALSGGVKRLHNGRIRRLGYLGRLVETKGIRQVIDAVAMLRAEGAPDELEFWLAGSGDARQALEQYATARGVGDFVKFLGTVSGDDKLEFLRQTDLLVLISPTEGMPYSVLEAMAVGTPVVASSVGGITDVIRDGLDGRIVPPEDADALASVLRELAAEPEAVRAISEAAAFRIATDYDLNCLAERFGGIYRALGARALTSLPSHAPTAELGGAGESYQH